MLYLPSLKTLLSFVAILLIVGVVGVLLLERSDNANVLGAHTSGSIKDQFVQIVSGAARSAVSEVQEKTTNLVTERAARVVQNQFEVLSPIQQEILKDHICQPPEGLVEESVEEEEIE